MNSLFTILITLTSFVQVSAPAEVAPHVNMFLNQVVARNLDIRSRSIIIDWLPKREIRPEGTALAMCFMSGEENEFARSILVDKELFLEFDKDKQELIIIHELGHCMFDLDHSDNPNDVMYWNIKGPLIPYMLDKAKLLNAFFQTQLN